MEGLRSGFSKLLCGRVRLLHGQKTFCGNLFVSPATQVKGAMLAEHAFLTKPSKRGILPLAQRKGDTLVADAHLVDQGRQLGCSEGEEGCFALFAAALAGFSNTQQHAAIVQQTHAHCVSSVVGSSLSHLWDKMAAEEFSNLSKSHKGVSSICQQGASPARTHPFPQRCAYCVWI